METGRVIETYPGKDDLVRVVKIRMMLGEFVRAVHQLYLLEPIDDKTNSKDPGSVGLGGGWNGKNRIVKIQD